VKLLILGVLSVQTLCVLSFFAPYDTQAQETRSLSVALNFDTPYDRPLQLEVSVRNHSFVVVPPSFTIIRPIVSSVTQSISLAAGQSSAAITFTRVLTEAIDYSIRVRCVNCPAALPTQYSLTPVSETGIASTTRVLGNSAYIDPEDLAQNLSVALETFGVISGQIQRHDDESSAKRIVVSVVVSNAEFDNELSQQRVEIKPNMASFDYRVEGLDRRFADNYHLQARCVQCEPKVISWPNDLDASLNYQGINFEVNQGVMSINGVLYILTE